MAHKKKYAVVEAERESNAEVDLRRPQNAIELTVKLQHETEKGKKKKLVLMHNRDVHVFSSSKK